MKACFPRLGVRKRRAPPPPVGAIPSDPHQGLVAAAARTFSFDELAAATRNFRGDYLVSAKEAALYKGYLKSVNQVVAIKQQDAADGRRSSEKCNSEFLAHVLKLSALRHPNLVSLIGFCADGNHRILVHEYMPLGSLEDHVHWKRVSSGADSYRSSIDPSKTISFLQSTNAALVFPRKI